MRLSLASAAFAILVATSGHCASARAQDFSITNKLEPADGSQADLLRQLQAWWDVHAVYPRDASANDQGGTFKIHIAIHPDGSLGLVNVLQGSGSCSLDQAGVLAFRYGHVRPLPRAMAEHDANVDVTLHYVLAHRHNEAVAVAYAPAVSKSNFTISNDPVKPTVVESVQQRVCTGTVRFNGIRNHPAYGWGGDVTAIFFRKPDGTPWIRFSESGITVYSPVTETGNALQWSGAPIHLSHGERGLMLNALYTVWPDGNDHLAGNTYWPGGFVDLHCTNEVVPAATLTPVSSMAMPPFQSAMVDILAGVCRP